MSKPHTRAGSKANLRDLITAIKVLKRHEADGIAIDEEEREVLSRFTGFGAVAAKAFPDPVTGQYAPGYEELGRQLRRLLTDAEYDSARRTTFSAFYTSPEVMQALWQGIERMGLGAGSTVLEPGCGIGNFIGVGPADAHFIGVEQDSISGRIAKALYPEHDIRIEGFQDTHLPEGAVDIAIGNVPFADIKLRHGGRRHALHDFFFLKALDTVRPGGALAFVTSRYTMDKANPAVRELLGKKADFVGAIRLPGGAFRAQGTEVVTDIIFLRKKLPPELANSHFASALSTPHREGKQAEAGGNQQLWQQSVQTALEGGEVMLNAYFRAHPEMVLGQMSVGRGMYNDADLRVRSDGEIGAALARAVASLPQDICPPRARPLTPIPPRFTHDPSLPEGMSEGSFFVGPDKRILQVREGTARPVMLASKPLKADGTPTGKKLAALIRLRDLARVVLKTQQAGAPDEDREAARKDLRLAYRAFTSRFGPINKTTISVRQDGGITRRMPNITRFKSDPDVYLVMALERYDERSATAEPAAIMQEDVVAAREPITRVNTARDGLLVCLNECGAVDLPRIAELYGASEAETVRELGDLIFFDPEQEEYVTADAYLSGNVRAKLERARACEDPRTVGNAKALERVQPDDLVAEEIDVTLGTPWIPAEDITNFLAATFGTCTSRVTVDYLRKDALWKVRPQFRSLRQTAAAKSEYGTEDVDAYSLVELALNMRTPTVRRPIPGEAGERTTYEVDQEATMAARQKQEKLKRCFSEWIFSDPARRDRLVGFYNERFNNLRLREFDGAHLTFPDMSASITMRPHQKDAIWRTIASGSTLLAHVVGAGKTFSMVASGMEMKRTGLISKPLYVVPNHMLEQFAREFLVLYPGANILVATKEDLRKDRRKLLKARIATGQWDGVVMTHSSFEKIAMSPGFEADFIAGELEQYEEMLTEVSDRSLKRGLTKTIEKLKEARRIKLGEMIEAGGKDDGLYFEELGVDQIFVDEAHLFKNLETATKMDRVAGIQTAGSGRAFDLLMKVRYLQSRTPGRGVTFATGTPVSNSLGEMYTMMRFLAPELLEERGIDHFDAWAANFGEVVHALEISPDGQSLRVNARFAKFKNLPELLVQFRMFADVKTSGMLDLPTPAIAGGKPDVVACPMSQEQAAFQETLVARYEKVKGGRVHPRVDNALSIVTDGRKLALDPRLIDPEAGDMPDGKVNQLVEHVYAIWEDSSEHRGTQLVFCDMGVHPTEWGFSVYDDVIEKLEVRGIPREEIAAIGDANTDQKKEALFANVRSGRVRVLLGSTTKMGTGTNVQDRLVALHHLDPPWRPADIEQREGRILRQGNRNEEVRILRYATEGSFDAYMWQTLETKAKFIAQAMRGDGGTRRADDIGGAELSFAEVKAIASGNPAMLILAQMEVDCRQLALHRTSHYREQARIREQLDKLPGEIEHHHAQADLLTQDLKRRRDTKGDAFTMTVGGQVFRHDPSAKRTARQRAQAAVSRVVAEAAMHRTPLPQVLGQLGGLDIVLEAGRGHQGAFDLVLQGEGRHHAVAIPNPTDCPAVIFGLERTLRDFDVRLARHRHQHEALTADLALYREQEGVPFADEERYHALKPLKERLETLLTDTKPQEPDASKIDFDVEIASIVDRYHALSAERSESQEVPTCETAQAAARSESAEVTDASPADDAVSDGPHAPAARRTPSEPPAKDGQLSIFAPSRPVPDVKPLPDRATQLGLFGGDDDTPSARVEKASAKRKPGRRRKEEKPTQLGHFTALVGQQMRLGPGGDIRPSQ